MLVTKDNFKECLANPNGIFFSYLLNSKKPTLIENYPTEEDFKKFFEDDIYKFEFYEKNDKFVLKYFIRQFIEKHWSPKFVYKATGQDGMVLVEFTVLDDNVSQKELVDGILFNLTLLHDILPNESGTRFMRITATIPDLIKLQFKEGEVKQKLIPEKQIEFMNNMLNKKIERYNQDHKGQSVCDWFISALLSDASLKNYVEELHNVIMKAWRPSVYQNPKTKKFGVVYVFGDFIGELVYIFNISHSMATQKFNEAIKAVEAEYKFDADAHYIKQVMEKPGYNLRSLQADFDYNMAFHLLMKESAKNKKDIDAVENILLPEKNPLVKIFQASLLHH